MYTYVERSYSISSLQTGGVEVVLGVIPRVLDGCSWLRVIRRRRLLVCTFCLCKYGVFFPSIDRVSIVVVLF